MFVTVMSPSLSNWARRVSVRARRNSVTFYSKACPSGNGFPATVRDLPIYFWVPSKTRRRGFLARARLEERLREGGRVADAALYYTKLN